MLQSVRWLVVITGCVIGVISLSLVPQAPASVVSQGEPANIFTRLVGPHTMAFAHYRVAELLKLPILQEMLKNVPNGIVEMDKEIQKLTTLKHNEIETVSFYFDMPRAAGGRIEEPPPPYVLIRTTSPIDRANLKNTVGKESETINFGKYEMHVGKHGVCALDDKTLFLMMFGGPSRSRENAKQALIPYFAMLETGNEIPAGLKQCVELATSQKHHAVMGGHISREMYQAAEEAMKEVPAAMSPFKALIKARSAYLTMDYLTTADKDFRIQGNLNFENEAAAKAGQGAVKFGIAMAKIGINSSMPRNGDAELKLLTQNANKQLDAIKTEVINTDVRVTFEAKTAEYLPMMTAAILKVRRAANQMLSSSNMRQCVIAMHNYHNDYNQLPASVTMKDGKPLHSWRVLLLPYLEQDNIFKQIRVNEPWNSEHNLKVFQSVPMPKFYQHPGNTNEESKTYYKVFTSKPGVQPAAGFSPGGKLTLGQLTVQDGTSNTLAMTEAGPPVLWYQPEDIEYDPKGAFPKLESPWPDNRVNCAFFDGSVRNFWLGQHEDIWRALITRNGGEEVDASKLEEKTK